MNFRTTIPISKSPFNLNYTDNIYLIGSCFSDSIGDKLIDAKFNSLINPFGTLFNPLSILDALRFSNPSDINDALYLNTNTAWYHHQFHSEFNGLSKEDLNILLNKAIKKSTTQRYDASTIIITLGSAYCYKHKATGQIVANCHKVPTSAFEKILLSVEDIVSYFHEASWLFENKNVILTISPVRHTKDTLPLNNVSKSTLRLACHQLESKYKNIHYFPSFELLTDDLRDYRYYKDDLIHPTDFAIEYVWKHFQETFFESKQRSIVSEVVKVKQAMKHRPINPNSTEHQKFLSQLLLQLKELNNTIDLSVEIVEISSQLKKPTK